MRNFIKSSGLKFFFKINSLLWRLILKLNGVKVGRNFYSEGTIYLKLRGDSSSKVVIGNNVSVYGDIDLRTRESGIILIDNNVHLDTNIRLVAARSGTIRIGEGTSVGFGFLINAGANVDIGKNVLIGPNVVVQSSNHGFNEPGDIKGQAHIHKPISVGAGSWLAANVVVLPGCNIGSGVVVGASAVVTKSIDSNSVAVGIPAKVVDMRPN